MTARAVEQDAKTPSELISAKIAGLGDWRGEVLARMRKLILGAVPDIVEAVKWRTRTNPAGVPVREPAGIICTGEIYKAHVKLTFAKGTLLPDPAGLFNGSLNGHTMRAIDIERGRIALARFPQTDMSHQIRLRRRVASRNAQSQSATAHSFTDGAAAFSWRVSTNRSTRAGNMKSRRSRSACACQTSPPVDRPSSRRLLAPSLAYRPSSPS